MVKLLLVLILALPAYPAFAQVSEADTALINGCLVNIDPAKKQLSPETADNCVKSLNAGTPALIVRYAKEDAEAAGRVIGYNNALIDLKRTVVKQEGASGAQALERILENPNCALCEMNLGPAPESTFKWVGDHASDRLEAVKKTVLTWDSLGAVRTASLGSADYGKSKPGWNSLPIIERYFELGDWAAAETARLEKAAKVPGAKLNIAGLAGILDSDLKLSFQMCMQLDATQCSGAKADGYKESLTKLKKLAEAAGIKEEAPKPSAADAKSKDLKGAADRMAAAGTAGQGDYLAATFDNATAGSGAVQAAKPGATAPLKGAVTPIKPVPMTDKEKADLGAAMISMDPKTGKPVGYLSDVMAQTEAGKRTIAFYSDPALAKAGTNKLDFGFKPMDGAFGVWNANEKTVRIGSEVVEEYAAERGLTVPQLMKDKAAMKDLALYLSPTFVHEAEHQNQTSRSIAGGYDYIKFPKGSNDPYTRAKENLSNKWSSEHMIEYCSKNGGEGCYKKFHEMHADNANKYKQGGLDALDTLKAPLYPHIDSMQGGAARQFKQAEGYATALKKLEAKNRTNPKGMSRADLDAMREYRQLMDTRFKWYTSMYQEISVAEDQALAFRKKYGGTGLASTVGAM